MNIFFHNIFTFIRLAQQKDCKYKSFARKILNPGKNNEELMPVGSLQFSVSSQD